MTYLAQRILQRPILHSQCLRLALISLALIALQATPARAQWTNGTDINNTNSGNVGIGTATPGAKLDISAGSTQAVLNINGMANPEIRLQHAGSTIFEIGIPTANGNYIIGSSNNDVIFRHTWGQKILFSSSNGSTNDLTLSAGNVGIGITTPSVRLHVVGDGKFTGSLTVDGNIAAKYQDVAEWVPASEQISAGTVVILDSTKSNHVISSTRAYDTRVAGVISEQPGIALGERGNGKVLVATTGRVRVKVDATRNPIHAGDLLVTSDVIGVAMKSKPIKVGGRLMHMPGTLIDKALEPLERGSGTILVLLSLQ